MDCFLKKTDCNGGYCNFEEIIQYCNDCSALLCLHCGENRHNGHYLTAFENKCLDWQSLDLINSIVLSELSEDASLANDVYAEVSRKFDIDLVDTSEEIWSCVECGTNNRISLNECQRCHASPLDLEEAATQYSGKLQKCRRGVIKYFMDMDTEPAAVLEHVVLLYAVRQSCPPLENLSIRAWFRDVYLQNREPTSVRSVALKSSAHSTEQPHLLQQFHESINLQSSSILDNLPNSVRSKFSLPEAGNIVSAATINSQIRIPESMLEFEATEAQIREKLSVGSQFDGRQRRMLVVEIKLLNTRKLGLLHKLLLEPAIVEFMNCRPNGSRPYDWLFYLRLALGACANVRSVLRFLFCECVVCSSTVPMSEMVDMEICDHKLCKLCFVGVFCPDIMQKFPTKWICPICPPANEDTEEEELNEVAQDRRHQFYTVIKNFFENERQEYEAGRSSIGEPPVDYKSVQTTFDDKLLREALKNSPDFNWCPNENCGNGFDVDTKNRIQCSKCYRYLCGGCGRKWQEDHEGRSCNDYEIYMISQADEEEELSKLLNEIGIVCPKCKMRYAVAAGGCLHFDCRACETSFCGGCTSIFVKNNCGLQNCKLEGLHAHHPRNCLYYLRDWDIEKLELLLADSDVIYRNRRDSSTETKCRHIITEVTMKDRPCGIDVIHDTGLCITHYKEYLVQYVNRSGSDPIYVIKDPEELNRILIQARLPPLTQRADENTLKFWNRQLATIRKCPMYEPNTPNNYL